MVKKNYFILLLAVFFAGLAFQSVAANMPPQGPAYISDTIRVTLRSGPSMENKVVSLLRVGQKIEVLEPGEDWTRIRAKNGKEGWVLSTFITASPPNVMLLEYARKKVDELSVKCADLKKANRKLADENRVLKQAVENSSKEAKKKIEQLARENRILRDSLGNRFIKWFLAGAGVILVGFFIGYHAKRDRNRLF